MHLVVHTPFGEFHGKDSKDQSAALIEEFHTLMQSAAMGKLNYLNFEQTNGNTVYLPGELLTKCVFVIVP